MEILPFITRLIELICSTEGSVPHPQTQRSRSGSINAMNCSAKKKKEKKRNPRKVAELMKKAFGLLLVLISVTTFTGSILSLIFQMNRRGAVCKVWSLCC